MDNKILLLKLIENFQFFIAFNDNNFKNHYSNLNINEVHTIDYICRNPHANVTRITEHLKITKGAVTKITKRLVAKGYLDVHQHENNKKEKYFTLTEKGKIIFDKHKTSHEESIERDQKIFDSFNDSEKKIIHRFLDILKNDFEEKLK